MNDLTPHLHRCPGCGRWWTCSDPACEPECRECQDEMLGDYLYAREQQLPLPDMPLVTVEEF